MAVKGAIAMTQTDLAAINSRLGNLEAAAQAQSETLAQILRLLSADGAGDGPTPIEELTMAVKELGFAIVTMQNEIVGAIEVQTTSGAETSGAGVPSI
jgi:hypothetical protein